MTGAVVSQVKTISSVFAFPALSVTVSLITYEPSALVEMFVSSEVVALNESVPGPETFDQRYEAMPEVTSLAVAF